jgi:hypothetical protein
MLRRAICWSFGGASVLLAAICYRTDVIVDPFPLGIEAQNRDVSYLIYPTIFMGRRGLEVELRLGIEKGFAATGAGPVFEIIPPGSGKFSISDAERQQTFKFVLFELVDWGDQKCVHFMGIHLESFKSFKVYPGGLTAFKRIFTLCIPIWALCLPVVVWGLPFVTRNRRFGNRGSNKQDIADFR